jgi:hypothetical protein
MLLVSYSLSPIAGHACYHGIRWISCSHFPTFLLTDMRRLAEFYPFFTLMYGRYGCKPHTIHVRLLVDSTGHIDSFSMRGGIRKSGRTWSQEGRGGTPRIALVAGSGSCRRPVLT